MDMTTGKAFLGVLAGLAAGTAIGIVISLKWKDPSKRHISRKTQDLAEALTEAIDEKFATLLKSVSNEVRQKYEPIENKQNEGV
jgi:hypothetical protein